MFRPRILPASDRRRAVILMVVLCMLTLFAIVGLAFLLYTQAEADSARAYRETATSVSIQPNETYGPLLDYAIGQLAFDVGEPVNGLFPDGSCSAARGHGFGRGMYGWNPDLPGNNIYAFNGSGRPHNTITLPFPSPPPGQSWSNTVDDHALISYVPYLTGVGSNPAAAPLLDGFVRDPERTGPFLLGGVTGFRTGIAQSPGGYGAGWNAGYTYPDGNSVYLGAYNSQGQVLARSFHRPYLIPQSPVNGPSPVSSGRYLPLDPNDPNYWSWTSNTNQTEVVPYYLKYTCLRPRPIDMAVPGMPLLFPAPGLGGDVKNLRGFPGPNDSIWIDLDYPVKTAANGVKYKPMFAFFVMDLDGRINLNAHGNARGVGQAHVSDQGWGKWEVNPAQLASATGNPLAVQEWPQLFVGSQFAPGVSGKYGPFNPASPPRPTNGGTNIADSGRSPHVYAQVNYDGSDDTLPPLVNGIGIGGGPGGGFSLPTAANASFPTFLAGYNNGVQQERTFHPSLYSPVYPQNDGFNFNRRFGAGNLVNLYNASATGSSFAASSLNCDIGKLLPLNMSSIPPGAVLPRIPHMVTTDSYGHDRPALSPWLWDRTSAQSAPTVPYGYTANPYLPPNSNGKQQPFPSWSFRTSPNGTVPYSLAANGSPNPQPTDSEFGLPGQANFSAPGVFNTSIDWRSIDAVLGKVNLNRFLPPYPHQGSGLNPLNYSSTPLTTDPNGRYDDTTNPNYNLIQAQYQAAQTARQSLADDIYRRLLRVTGVPAVAPASLAAPQPSDLAPRRWLAQLAANIVDFIDEDDISTPFNFYTTNDAQSGTFNIYDIYANPNPNLTATVNTQSELLKYWVYGTELPKLVVNEVMAEYATPATLPGNMSVNLFVELFNPMPSAAQQNGGNASTSVQALDSLGVPLYFPAAGGGAAYCPYEVWITDNNPTTKTTGGLLQDPSAVNPATAIYANDNVLGTPNFVRTQITEADFVTNNIPSIDGKTNYSPNQAVGPQGFLVLRPGPDARGTVAAAGAGAGVVPATTPTVTSAKMSYTVNVQKTTMAWQIPGNPQTITDGPNGGANVTGVSVVLRRLANPHLPYNPTPTAQNPTINPYITIDSMTGVTPVDSTSGKSYGSTTKNSPYVSLNANNQYTTPPYVTAAPQKTTDSFGAVNNNNAYTWLVHLDRQLLNPMELLQVSGFHPHQLTLKFDASFDHLINWNDETNRLYRIFEFVTTRDRTSGVSFAGREPGKVNINTVWDAEILAALADSPAAAGIFQSLLKSRSPGVATAPFGNPPYGNIPQVWGTDRPFQSFGIGNLPANNNGATPIANAPPGSVVDPQALNDDGTAKATSGGAPATTGIEDTILRSLNNTGVSTDPRLFDVPGATHPYQAKQALTKIYGNLTTRSNVFAVWCTVGYFEVAKDGNGNYVGDQFRPVKLGAELGAATNTNIRPRFFAVIDRSRMVIAPSVTTTVNAADGVINTLFQPTAVHVGSLGGTVGINNIPWGLPGLVQQPGQPPTPVGPPTASVVVIDNGNASEETVVVPSVTALPQAQFLSLVQSLNLPPNNTNQPIFWLVGTFEKPHGVNAGITISGNPGPQPKFSINDTSYPGVIATYGILE